MYDNDMSYSSALSLEVGAEDGPEFEEPAEAQRHLHAAFVAHTWPATGRREPADVGPHHSVLQRFSKDSAIYEDIQQRFMIAVENDEKAAKKRVQDMLVSRQPPVAA